MPISLLSDQRAGSAASPTGTVALLVFTLNGNRYALAAEDVREVVRAAAWARLPKAPPIVEGVINVRGAVVPVLDVRGRFELPERMLHPEQHFIVADAGARVVALRVDQARELIAVERSAIETAESAVPGVQYVAGIARLADGLVVIHDLPRFLALDEARDLDQALAELEDAE